MIFAWIFVCLVSDSNERNHLLSGHFVWKRCGAKKMAETLLELRHYLLKSARLRIPSVENFHQNVKPLVFVIM